MNIINILGLSWQIKKNNVTIYKRLNTEFLKIYV